MITTKWRAWIAFIVFAVKGARFALAELVRDMRDDLHFRLMKWDEAIKAWAGLEPVMGEKQENALKQIYRFAAHNFPQRQD